MATSSKKQAPAKRVAAKKAVTGKAPSSARIIVNKGEPPRQYADLHDHREANSTKEVYALESRQIGVRVNRQRVAIPRQQLVAISLLDDL